MVTIRAGNGLKMGGIVYIILFFILLPFMVLSDCIKKNK
nr:MAG TPA: hypothetical protein [Caudoviricetes sp.]